MKRLLVALFLLLPAHAFAEFACENSAQTTQYGTAGQCGPVAMDTKGNQYVTAVGGNAGLIQSLVPLSSGGMSFNGVGAPAWGYRYSLTDTAETGSTTTVINATSHAAKVGDLISFYSGVDAGLTSLVTAIATNTITVAPAFPSAPANGNGFYILRSAPVAVGDPVNSGGAGVIAVVDSAFRAQTSYATNLLKLEDAGHSSGDAGVQDLGVLNTTFFFARAGTQGDYVPFQMDTDGRLAINPFGAQVTDFISGCSSAITTNTTGTVISADADERFYITSWDCTNTGAAATRVVLEDADGNDLANTMLAATTGASFQSYPTPVRLAAVNKALQINVITTGSSTICCARGFKAAN